MSHNVITVEDVEPDRQGDITGVPFDAFGEMLIGQAGSDNYSNSGATTLTNTDLYFYDASPVNTITGASITSSSNWVSSFTLPAGRYLINVAFNVVFSSSGQFAYQLHDGSSLIGNRAQIGATVQFATESAMSLASAMVFLSSSTTFTVKSPTGNTNIDTIANQGTTPSTFSFIRVIEL